MVALDPFRSSLVRRAGSGLLRAARVWVPPVAAGALRRRFSEFEFVPGGWPAASSAGGWADPSVVAAQEKHWPLLMSNLAGTGPLGVSHLPGHMTRNDHSDHNIMMSFGYVLGLAAADQSTLSLLDWGGGAGHYLRYAGALRPGLSLDYTCFDLESMCRLGARLVPEARFSSDEAEVLARAYDLAVSSSSLHYFRDWQDAADKLASVTGRYLYIARLQTVTKAGSFVVKQTPRSSGYNTDYPSWFLNRDEVVTRMEARGLTLVREFVFEESWNVRRAPEQGKSRGFLFKRG